MNKSVLFYRLFHKIKNEYFVAERWQGGGQHKRRIGFLESSYTSQQQKYIGHDNQKQGKIIYLFEMFSLSALFWNTNLMPIFISKLMNQKDRDVRSIRLQMGSKGNHRTPTHRNKGNLYIRMIDKIWRATSWMEAK